MIGHLSRRQAVHAQQGTDHAVTQENVDVRERSLPFSGEPEVFAHACVEIKSISTLFMCVSSRNKA